MQRRVKDAMSSDDERTRRDACPRKASNAAKFGDQGKAASARETMRWFGLDSDTGNVRRTGQTSLCFQEESAGDGLRNKRLVAGRLTRPAPKRGGMNEKNADSAL